MMNSNKTKLFFFVVLILLQTACGKDDPATPDPTLSENSWKLDSYKYSRRTSTQTSTTFTNGDPFTIVYTDSNIATANSPFTNCSLIMTFNTSTTGEYVIKSEATTVSDTKLKYMYVKCIVLSGAGTGACYESTDGNLKASVTQVNGKYVVSIPAGITLARTYNDGLTQAPENFVLMADRVQ